MDMDPYTQEITQTIFRAARKQRPGNKYLAYVDATHALSYWLEIHLKYVIAEMDKDDAWSKQSCIDVFELAGIPDTQIIRECLEAEMDYHRLITAITHRKKDAWSDKRIVLTLNEVCPDLVIEILKAGDWDAYQILRAFQKTGVQKTDLHQSSSLLVSLGLAEKEQGSSNIIVRELGADKRSPQVSGAIL